MTKIQLFTCKYVESDISNDSNTTHMVYYDNYPDCIGYILIALFILQRDKMIILMCFILLIICGYQIVIKIK